MVEGKTDMDGVSTDLAAIGVKDDIVKVVTTALAPVAKNASLAKTVDVTSELAATTSGGAERL